MVIVTMEILWSVCLLAVLASVHPAQTHTGLQGLSCVNDYVNNVSCVWNSSHIEPGVDCWIFGQKTAWALTGRSKPLIKSCKLKQLRSSVRGCSFVFEKKMFSWSEIMPRIYVQCNGMTVKNLTNYKPCDHIKMHPPDAPNVTTHANDTWISWSPGSPRSEFFTHYEFQLQTKQNHQKWEEANTFPPTEEQKQIILAGTMRAGQYQVRVRVKPSKDYPHAHWSDWSPVTSWVIASDVTEDKVPPPDRIILWLLLGGLSFIIILIILLRGSLSKGLFKGKPVPNPSNYFHTLHSVHGGNIKKWLNPQTAAESFFTAQPHDQISPVEVFDVWDVVPSSSPSSSTTTTTSTSALLHSHSGCPSSDLDTSGVVDRSSSSSSSCFSNLGYFYSSYPGTSLRIDPGPVYFTYRDDFRDGCKLHLSLCPSLTGSSAYESLRWPRGEHNMEPQSPDSGFGVGEEDQVDLDEVYLDPEEVPGDHDDSPLLTFPLQLPSWMCPPSSSSPPCPPSSSTPPFHPPSPPQVHPDNENLNVPVIVSSGSYVSLPVGGAMCRSSSMPVEACKTGYLTLKELQTTYSNKSI